MDAVKGTSPRAEHLISEYDLGRVRAEYKGSILKNMVPLSICVPFGLMIYLLVLSPLFSFPHIDESWFEVLRESAFLLFLGGLFLLVGIIGVIAFIMMLWQGEQRVYLGEKGFISAHRRPETVARWEDVQEINQRIFSMQRSVNGSLKITTSHAYIITPTEGKKISISADPGPAIEQAVTTHLLPRTLTNYAAGKMLSFGCLRLDRKGLHLTSEVPVRNNAALWEKLLERAQILRNPPSIGTASGERFLPWEDLACYWIDESRCTLVLSKVGERRHWAILPLSHVPNVALCLAVIKYVLYEKPRGID